MSPAPYHTLNVGYGTDDAEENVARNRDIFIRAAGVGRDLVVAASLRHGNDVAVFRQGEPIPAALRPVRPGSQRSEPFFHADGVVSDVPNLHVLLTCADCVPVLFFDERRGVLGAAHAGWRGTAARIAVEVVGVMQREFGSRSRDIRAGIGPSVGPCCYSVVPDVIHTFERNKAECVTRSEGEKTYLDLWSSNECQLTAAGVEAIERADICTACCTDTYFSHRAERGVTGRFALLAGLPG